MAITHSTVSVNTTAVAVVPARSRAQRIGARRTVVVWNSGANPVFLGGAGVTSSTGIQLAAGAQITLELGEADALMAIATTGPNAVKVLAV